MISPECAPAGVIVPGRLFRDDTGATAQLHGVGIHQFDGRFYAWGEDKTRGSLFTGIACYSSVDLATWTSHGHALAADRSIAELGPDRVIERPKVLRTTRGTYVMFLHIDTADYSLARLGRAVADRPEGPYSYLGSERPLGNVSRDIGVFQDEDGTGYVLSEDRENGLHIYRLTPDFLGVEEIVSTTLALPGGHPAGAHGYESPTLVSHEGLYYLFGSDLTGWSMNDNKYATATALEGPWSDWSDFAPAGSATFDSQTSVVLPVRGSEQTSFVYIGDRWIRDDLSHSPPVWLPLHLGDGTARLEWRHEWRIEPGTGRIS
ncbi:family 43 glycosylhydrolase [Microbacterium panaciterrae]